MTYGHATRSHWWAVVDPNSKADHLQGQHCPPYIYLIPIQKLIISKVSTAHPTST
ncbi:hypothetical protein BJP36_43245 [Moorena producens JHB]|uniref:Uncharacterized protein n=1 Tax=Moorena producens (strain JHB) TaxID=1454205 RepID=A0A9Q9ST68_MOOP1|nr:hypothetical protein [Moorena producens]WAN69178.1 hypothetical protein BJP36_43245 [Moorena producens JHB]